MGVFKGIRTKNGAFVTYDDAPLDLRLDLKEHSPLGFEWGYNGSGPKQLALAIMAKFSTEDTVLKYYKEFAESFIYTIEDNEWELEDSLVLEWMKCNEIICDKPILTPRFKILSNFIFLDNKKLGQHLLSNKYNIDFGK
ncbi:MAG: DUF6166 domain-containing protein, partial [Thiovulaceae bacterium]|nr:DUF6166 domain-containing protein [Sulfurimonadaceae bacterium]